MSYNRPRLLWLRSSVGTTVPGGPTGPVTFIVVNDVVYITYGDIVSEAPVTPIGSTSVASGIISAEGDKLLFHYLGGVWQSPAAQIDAVPSDGEIDEDTFYINRGGVRYSMPVTAAPLSPEEPTSVLVTSDDGTQYEMTTYADGSVRYKVVYEEIP